MKEVKIGFLFLIIGILFTACSASKHVGVTTVKKPDVTNTNLQDWYNFYEDQIDAYKGGIVGPSSNDPDVAREAYQKAHLDYSSKQKQASMGNWAIGALGSIFLVLVIIPAIIK